MNSRAAITIAFPLAVVFLVAGLAWMLLRFALPQPGWVEAGSLADYPPSDQPYKVDLGTSVFFLTHQRGEMLALDPINPTQGGAVVRWWPDQRAFIDPGRGAWFDLSGLPIQRAVPNSLVENHGLRHYPVKVENGLIFVDLSRPTSYPAGEGSP